MEKIVRIKSQGTLQERDWTNERTGEKKVIKSLTLEVTDGIDTFLVDASDTLAEALAKSPLRTDVLYGLRCRMVVNETMRESGEKRRFTNIKIINIVQL